MADKNPQTADQKTEPNPPASLQPQDHYAVLKKVIDDVTHDHTMLRKLVYALAWQSLKPEVIVKKPIADAQSQAKTIVELEQALQLERAIKQIEGEIGSPDRDEAVPPRRDQGVAYAGPLYAKSAPASTSVKEADAAAMAPESIPPSAPAPEFTSSGTLNVDHPNLVRSAPSESSAEKQDIERDPRLEALDASFDPPLARGEIVALPEPRSRQTQNNAVYLERIPSWLDPSIRVSLDSVEYAPFHQPLQQKSNIFSFFQLVAASVIGVVLYTGISGWFYLGRPGMNATPPAVPPRQQLAREDQPAAGDAAPASNSAPAPAARPEPEPQPILPFPLPRSYGVYAGIPGQIFELEQLPIKVPDPRVQASAEITKASSVTTPGENLSFVVFRRELPQTAVVRVVAHVQRNTKYVNGKPAVVPMQGVWRIRSKAYELKVSPLEGRNEMVVIQPNPGFVFSPGRYALVLNGFGYDFTVAGKIVAPEQCLEQVEVVNGAVLSECPKI
jgi:hypothetical protein